MESASDVRFLTSQNITCILSIIDKKLQYKGREINHKKIKLADTSGCLIAEHFDACNKFIEESMEQGKGILVHCQMGVSRSASVVVAYLMNKRKWEYSTAIDFVRKKRSKVDPNVGFKIQLQVYHRMKWTFEKENFLKEYEGSCLEYIGALRAKAEHLQDVVKSGKYDRGECIGEWSILQLNNTTCKYLMNQRPEIKTRVRGTKRLMDKIGKTLFNWSDSHERLVLADSKSSDVTPRMTPTKGMLLSTGKSSLMEARKIAPGSAAFMELYNT